MTCERCVYLLGKARGSQVRVGTRVPLPHPNLFFDAGMRFHQHGPVETRFVCESGFCHEWVEVVDEPCWCEAAA
jgi:hypothetical protein